MTAAPLEGLVDHLFRHGAGRMVATLARIFGPEHLDLAQDVVQEALLTALTQWSYHGVPDNPGGWLFRVARNKALDSLRREASLREKEPQIAESLRDLQREEDLGFAHELRDDELRMMLMCCHPAISEESRIALTLKTVGGFSVDEIARAFLTQKTTIAQRLVRAKRTIREEHLALDLPSRSELAERLDTVLRTIYLMFNEGYGAYAGEELIRRDLCDEAIRLAEALTAHEATHAPQVDALLALMYLQAARLDARVDATGELAVLADQDRSLWDAAKIRAGLEALDRAASGDAITPYHVEAAIAACHTAAPSFEETDWLRVIELYDDLLAIRPSPVVVLNRAIALAMAHGPQAGIEAIGPLDRDPALREYVHLPATLGELWLRAGDRQRAAGYFAAALALPSTAPAKRFLLRKIEQCR
ncbi:MAG TPA: sigma-70 family RNA polymerase sigma factor [Thermoanaerobaculia bacterium]|nr:sigma-70 family RNA polymerase sigma factor [Thermoanaerobaculia bacterium]